MNIVRSALLVLSFSLLMLPSGLLAQDATPDGKAIFKAQCASCHNKNMKGNLTGPALGGVQERWADYPESELYDWIRNSQKQIAEGHPRAKQLWAEWGPTVMTAFPNLTDAEIAEILIYVEEVYTQTPGKYYTAPVGGPEVAGGAGGQKRGINPTVLAILLVVLGVFAVALARIISNLNYLAKVRAGEEAPEKRTLVELLTSRSVISFIIFALVVLGGYTTVNNAIELGRQQGYAPNQPIKFSHETHAGLNKIDCQYCHDGARRSKHASIPGVNTCMNCHSAIKVGSQYGTQELSKIYASAGWNPITGKYIENYEQLAKDSIEKIEAIFRTWVETNVREAEPDRRDSYINKTVDAILVDGVDGAPGVLDFVANPIEWTRIHNLPDHAYFNHAQHVTVGKVDCQECHGPVEEMEVLYQYSPLSMGWCINCHRQTEVKFANNDYYTESYEQYHKDLENGDISKVVVEDVGGLECQKCHY